MLFVIPVFGEFQHKCTGSDGECTFVGSNNSHKKGNSFSPWQLWEKLCRDEQGQQLRYYLSKEDQVDRSGYNPRDNDPNHCKYILLLQYEFGKYEIEHSICGGYLSKYNKEAFRERIDGISEISHFRKTKWESSMC